ncbi:alpha-2-macroglobulin family protein [Flavihumibacter fluvii]|uniref:alpha-2-macroglobulin family protein n=1 Tax=Flavihumibacter fluvii TaxID=2838157 RepID=UPI001BDE2630|nr:MG2 domain-containing protein [Flavihumibacter fluvii]ULQ52046.1 MG2 domain-containing protein [Flavihumibacter fluvii]
MFTKYVRLLMVLCAIGTVACNRSTVSLEYTNANKEVKQLQNLVFRFNHPLAGDSMLNRWDSTEYVRFEPAIQGRFRWESPDQLVFSPEKPLAPATSYKATISKAVLGKSTFNDLAVKEELVFFTPNLTLESTNAQWVLQDETTRVPVLEIDLLFNYRIAPESLKEKLHVTIEGKNIGYQLLTASAEDKLRLRLPGIKAEDKEYNLVIGLDEGLVPVGGKNPSKEKTGFPATISSPFVLIVNTVETEHDGTTGKIMVKTSQQIDAPSLNQLIKINPTLKFSTEITDDGFMISSDQFSMDKSYRLTLQKGIRGKIGGQLKEEYENNIAFGKLEPSISFTLSKAAYLSAAGNRNIEVRITSIDKVKIIVSKIYDNNLLAAQRYGYSPIETAGESYEYDYGSGGDASFGDVIFEKEVDTRSLAKSNGNYLFNFSIEDKIPDLKGSYHIKIRSTEDYWISDSRFISLSDIGLVAKEGKEKLFVFANSIKTAASLKDVHIIAYGANNQVLAMGATNADGVAELAYSRKDFAGFRPAMVIAKTENDFNYLVFSNTGVNTSRYDVGGKSANSTGLEAFVYGERDIYRPGERVNFAMIVRDKDWLSPGEIPVKFKFLLPTGKELKSFRKNLNMQGAADGSIDIPVAAITGTYTLEVYSGNDVLITSSPFMIEEFVPDRIKVTAKLDKTELQPNEKVNLSITATNFFGPPAANRNYECEIQVKQKMFYPRKYNAYNFNLSNQKSFFDKKLIEGMTNADGQAAASYTVPELYQNIGLLQASLYTTVFDETGRPVSRSNNIDIYTQSVFYGIGDNGYDYFTLNQEIRFPLIAIDKNEKPVSASAKVEVIKHEYRTVLTKSGGYFRYDSQTEDKVVATGNTSIAGEQSSYSFTPRSPGNYEIRVSIPGSVSYVSRSFYSYGSWGGENNSFEVNTEGQIDINTDKEKYTAGEKVRLLFKAPFSGRMLVTMEKDKVLSYQYVQVDKRTASIDLPLTKEHLPNVYITATLIKPHSIADIPLTVAHGFKSVTVEEASRKMTVEIIAAAAVRSKTRQKITVKAPAGSMVTLAAVDNGVLQVSDFKTPDPYAAFYAKRALAVNAYDLYPLLFPEIKATRSSTGGDADRSMDQRVNPMQNKRIKILSYWSGLATTNNSGEAGFEFEIPQFSGEVRLMAVAAKNESFGHAEKAMKVADPIVLSTALPRFLSPGDSITVPVNISNTTAKATSAKAAITVNGPLEVSGPAEKTTQLGANSESMVAFTVVAKKTIGVGEININVQGGAEKFTDATAITVRPPSTLQKITGSGVISSGSTQKINMGAGDFMPGTSSRTLIVSRSPALELANQLSTLVQYPYGCTEQTVSAAFPQLYFGDLAELMQTRVASKNTAAMNVIEAIRKIKMRQLYSGAVTLWDNSGTENWWATIYAAHFLLEAKKAGYDIEQSLLETMLNYINNQLNNKSTVNYIYNRNQQKKIAPKEVAYTLYVLSAAGRPNISVMNYYKAKPAILSLDARYLLSAAYAISGDKAKFRELLPGSFAGEESETQSGGSFYSPIRDESIALNALLEVDPGNAQVPVMAKHVAGALKQRSWYSTQESAFGFLAIGKLAAAANKSTATADISINGKNVGKLLNVPIKLNTKEQGGTIVTITTKGNGSVYYWWQSEGISSSGAYKEEDNYLKIRRRFFDRNGRPIAGNNFMQNDLVIVQLVLEKSYSGTVENIVLTDLIPAGFEIENPRTKDIPGMDWIKDAETPTALDARDDRIHLFVDATRARQAYYYAVRAVSPGVYQMGPASADAMYNGEYHSYHGAARITVTRKP